MPTAKYALTIDSPLAVADYASVTYTEMVTGTMVYAIGADVALGLGGVTTCDFIYLKGTTAFSVKFNGSATAFPVDANMPFFCAGTAITAATITNVAECTLTYVIAGA